MRNWERVFGQKNSIFKLDLDKSLDNLLTFTYISEFDKNCKMTNAT